MAKVQITNVTVLDNPSPFQNPIQFEITFECIEDLTDDLEWKIIYVGSAESEEHDQTLDSVLVGPVPSGRHMFVFQAEPPDPAKIPGNDVIGVTAVILTCGFREREFVRVGYYVNNDYVDPELRETPPPTPQYDKLQRDIFASKPIVTRFKIDWDDTSAPPPDAVPIVESTSDTITSSSAQMPMAAVPAAHPPSQLPQPPNGPDGNLNFPPSKADVFIPPVLAEGIVGGPAFNGCVQNGTNGSHYEDSNCTMDTN